MTPPVGRSGPSDVVVGVDGGGSGCRVLLTTLEGREVARGAGPPALVVPHRPGEAAKVVARLVEDTVGRKGLALPARALWAGLAGAGRVGSREGEEIALRSRGLAREVRVGMDVEGAHRDAFGGDAGVLLVVGTGAVAWGRDPEGRELRVGGWGDVLADEGSGYWLGREALRAVTRAADGRGEATLLTSLLLEKLHLPDAQALVPWSASATKGQVAALAPLVIRARSRGDGVAAEVVERGVDELRRYLEVVAGHWAPWGGVFPLAMVGGLVEEDGPLRDLAAEAAAEVGGRLRKEPVDPARGAADLALELASFS